MPDNDVLKIVRAFLMTPTLMELGPGPRAGVRPLRELSAELDEWSRFTRLPATRQSLVRAAVLLWHDHHDASHEISQRIEAPDGSWLHGILHRREPDYGNAKYWFHRVGAHAGYGELARRAGDLIAASGAKTLAAQLLPGGVWDAYAFVDAVEQAADMRDTNDWKRSLVAIQQAEIEVLLERLCASH